MATERTDNDAKKAGSYLKEKFVIGLSRITHDEVERAVAKVSSHKLKLPNEKHMLRLLQASYGHYNAGKHTYENVNEFIVSELEKRTHVHDWIVVLKTFLVFHRFMHDGSPDVNEHLQRNRRIFCGSYIKDLADSPDGANQQRVIQQYSRYLEERLFAEKNLGFGYRMETEEFTRAFTAESEGMGIAKLSEPLLMQLEALLDVEYADATVTSEATLKLYENLVTDAKRIYVLLTDRMRTLLDLFEHMFQQSERKKVAEVYKRYHLAVIRVSQYFERMRSGEIHFTITVPSISPLPESLLEGLELALLEGPVQHYMKKRSSTPERKEEEPTAAGSSAQRAAQGTTSSHFKQQKVGGVDQPPTTVQSSRSTSPSQSHSRQYQEKEEEPQPLHPGDKRLSDLFSPTVVSAPAHCDNCPPIDLFSAMPESPTTGSPPGIAPGSVQWSGASAGTSPSTTPVPPVATTHGSDRPAPVVQGGTPPPQSPPALYQKHTHEEVTLGIVGKQDSITKLFNTAPPYPGAPPGYGVTSTNVQPAETQSPSGGFDPFADHAAPKPPPGQKQTSGQSGPIDFFATPAPTQKHQQHPSQTPPEVDPFTGKARAW